MEEHDDVRSVQVASYLNVSKPSVSEMLRSLDREGFIQYKKYSKINLTRTGKNYAKNLTAKHRIIETFLKNTLKISSSTVHEEAHRLEHAFSDESIIKLNKFLGSPKLDPHGKPIPKIY